MRIETVIWTSLWLLVATAALATQAQAWPANSGGGVPIAEAQKNDTGSYFTIEGVVRSSSQSRFFTVQDRTGKMIVVIPQYITREQGVPESGERIRVFGKYDHKKLDATVKGMRVTRLTRLGRMAGAKGDPSPNQAPIPNGAKASTPPAAAFPRDSDASIIQPTAAADLKERLRAKRIEFAEAKKGAEAAGAEYADALYAAGDGPVDSDVQGKLREAEAKMASVADSILPLLDEAREAGIPNDLIQLYQRSTGISN